MTHQVYGVHVMHPASAIMPREMPDTANIPVRLFETPQEAAVYASQMAARRGIRATEQPVGINNTRCLIPGVAIHYTINLTDEEFAQFQKEKTDENHPVSISINDARVGVIAHTHVHLYEDALHYAGDFHPSELSEEMAARWYDFQHLDRALKRTDPEVLKTIDFTNANTRENFRMVYGANGLLNQEFFTPNPSEDLLRSLQRTLTSGEFGAGYSLCIKEMEEQYHATYRASREEGLSEQASVANAGMMACQVVRLQATQWMDNNALQNFVAPGMAFCQEMLDTDKGDIPQDISDDEEPDIFE